MSAAYQETIEGEAHLRLPPGARHELICSRLHQWIGRGLADVCVARLLPARSAIVLSRANTLCPDLALITAATGKLWLAAEVVNSEDHRADTVLKKQIYEEIRVPRLWMVDPRYDNVEIYHSGEFGMTLKSILAGRDLLTEKLLPHFQPTIAELFAA